MSAAMGEAQNQANAGVMPPALSAGAPKLGFGIYPGGALGTGSGIAYELRIAPQNN